MNADGDREDRANKVTVQLKADLATVITRDIYDPWPGVVLECLLDVSEALMRRSVRLVPDAKPVLLERIGRMHANVQGIAPLEPTTGPMH